MSVQLSTERIILGLADSNKDPNLLMKNESSGMKNFFKFGDFIGIRPGRTAYGTFAGIVMGYYHFKVGDNNRFCKMTSTGFAYRSSTGWVDVTGAALTGTIDNFFDACTVYDSVTGTAYVVFTNGVDNIRKFDGSNDTSDMSGWTSYKARFVRYLGGYLIAAHLTDGGTRYSFRLRTSHTDKPNDTTSTNSKTFNLTRDKNISDIVKMEYFGNYIAVYKTDCIYMLWLGSSVNILDFEVRVHETGLRASRALCVDNKGGHWFMGYDDIYYWASPNSAVIPVGIGSIRNRLFKNTAPGNLERAVAVYDRRYNQVRFYVPTSYYLDTVYCIDLNDKQWSWWQEATGNITAVGSYFKDTIVTIDDLSGTIDSLTGTIDDLSGELEDNFPVIIEGDKDGNSAYIDENAYLDGNITIEGHYDTGDDVFKNEEELPYSLARIEGVKVEARGKQKPTYSSTTKLFASFDGINSGISFTAETGQIATFVGAAKLDTSQKKYGASSLLLDGNSDYLTFPDSDDWAFGSGDFTIDCYVRFDSLTGVQSVMGQYENGSNLWAFYKDATNKLTLWFFSGGAFKGYVVMTSAWALTTDAWYHLAAVRNGSSVKIYIDGVSQELINSVLFNANDVGNVAGVLNIGNDGRGVGNHLNGSIDEIRIVKGVAKWTSNFTPVEFKGDVFLDRLYLYRSSDEGATWTAIASGLNPDGTTWTDFITLSTDWEWYECHFDVVVGKIRYRLENNIASSTCQVQKMVRMGEDREEDK